MDHVGQLRTSSLQGLVRANLAFGNVISHCEIPICDFEGRIGLQPWPLILPHDMARVLLQNGHRKYLGVGPAAFWQKTANNAIGLLYQSRTENGLLMEDQDIKQIQAVGSLFLETYMQLHAKYQGFCGYKLWNLRPKTHLWQHLLESCSRIRNPLVGSCWMDEDWLRGVMAVARKTHSAKTQSSTLKRYCAGLCSVKCFFRAIVHPPVHIHACMHLFLQD